MADPLSFLSFLDIFHVFSSSPAASGVNGSQVQAMLAALALAEQLGLMKTSVSPGQMQAIMAVLKVLGVDVPATVAAQPIGALLPAT